MADLVGYILDGPGGEVRRWGGSWGQAPGIPNPLDLPNGKQILAPVVGEDYEGFTLSEWLMDEPTPETPSTPSLCCLANLHVDAGEVGGAETATGMSFAFMAGPDTIWLFFSEPFEAATYGWNVSTTSGAAKVSDRQLDYIEITVTGATEPYDISVQIYRIV